MAFSPISHSSKPVLEFWKDSPCLDQVQAALEKFDDRKEHLLFKGARGSGRSSLLSCIDNTVKGNSKLSVKWFPVLFPEEMHHVCSPGEVLHELVLQIASNNDNTEWKTLYHTLSECRDPMELEQKSLEAITLFSQSMDKRLLFLIDNLDTLLEQVITPGDRSRLLGTLTQQPEIMIIGTSILPDQDTQWASGLERRFWIIQVDPMDLEHCGSVWESVTGQKIPRDRVRPMAILTQGNRRFFNRLAMISRDYGSALSPEGFFRFMETCTDYFKTRLTALPPLERKVFVCLADAWKPVTAREIADLTRMDVNKASAYLQRLVARGEVMVTEQQGRKKFYRIEDRLFNTYLLFNRKRGSFQQFGDLLLFMDRFYGLNLHTSPGAEL